MLPTRSQVTVIATIVLLAVSCTSTPSSSPPASQTSASTTLSATETPPSPPEQAPTMNEPNETLVEATLLDEKTAVFPAGTDIFDDGSLVTTATPASEDVDVALAALATTPDLSWINEHARLISGYSSEGATQIRIDLSCEATPFATPADALRALRDVRTIDGGGACYGFAFFDADGQLVQSGTNGES